MSRALHDIAALRTIEARAGEGSGLMERAGEAAWRALLERWPQALRIAVVCGPGNNGGDGDVLARLAHAAGREVVVVRQPGHAPRGDLAREVHARLLDTGIDITADPRELAGCDVIVDALLGIGLSREPDAVISGVIDAINAAGLPVLALDVPSGVDAATGFAYPAAVRATHTIEFIAAKAGLRTGAARGLVGTLTVASLGVRATTSAGSVPFAYILEPSDLGAWLQPRAVDSHKGTHGRVLCIGGDVGQGGAILLAAEAALRSGAGLVDIETRGRHVAAALARVPEAMAQETRGADALARRIAQATTCVLGPGLGQGRWGAMRFEAAIALARQLVLDADGLNLLATRSIPLAHTAILTPHPGEAARLLGCDTRDVQRDRFAAARRISDRYGAIVVLKGAGTLVVGPGQTPCVIDAGNPGMAVGGMGDVLAGVIGALWAQGLAPFDAARAGALLHAAAGDVAAHAGERGLLPSDLMPHLRRLSNPVKR